jgi:predicted homoserine dehydrogenase-like protein
MESYGMILGIIMSEKTGQALLYRPQHLVGLEAPISIARTAVYHESTGAPRGWFSEVITVAKKRLRPGTLLDGEGGYTAYGLAERAEVAREENLLPFGLCQDAVVRREISEDRAISYDDVELQSSPALSLRMLQETSLKSGAAL